MAPPLSLSTLATMRNRRVAVWTEKVRIAMVRGLIRLTEELLYNIGYGKQTIKLEVTLADRTNQEGRVPPGWSCFVCHHG